MTNTQPDSTEKNKEPHGVRGIFFVTLVVGTILAVLYIKRQNKSLQSEKDVKIEEIRMELVNLKTAYSQYNKPVSEYWPLFVPKKLFQGMNASRYDTLMKCDVFLHDEIKDCKRNMPTPGNQKPQ